MNHALEQKRGYTAMRELTIAQQPADDRSEEESERTAEEHPTEGRQEHRLEDTGHHGLHRLERSLPRRRGR